MLKNSVQQTSQNLYINSNQPDASAYFAAFMHELLFPSIIQGRELVLLCIGTDRITGDSLGPIIGHNLSGAFSHWAHTEHRLHIYGTLENPVHAKNLAEALDGIYSNHTNPLIVAIDASLGKSTSVGFITIGVGALTPGAGVKKLLPSVGDIHVTGIVNTYGNANFAALQNTRLALVVKLADIITGGFIRVLSP